MIYDVVIGSTLPTRYGYTYIQGDYINRVETEDINSYSELASLILTNLKEYMNRVSSSDSDLMNILSEFELLVNDLSNGNNDEGADVRIRELLSALSYIGVELYVIRRADLDSDSLSDTETRAYMVDKHDAYFPSINRVVNGKSYIFEDTLDANISTVALQFLQDINFSGIVEDVIKLEYYREKFEALQKAKMGWSLPVERLVDFLNDYGYKFVVVL